MSHVCAQRSGKREDLQSPLPFWEMQTALSFWQGGWDLLGRGRGPQSTGAHFSLEPKPSLSTPPFLHWKYNESQLSCFCF